MDHKHRQPLNPKTAFLNQAAQIFSPGIAPALSCPLGGGNESRERGMHSAQLESHSRTHDVLAFYISNITHQQKKMASPGSNWGHNIENLKYKPGHINKD